jgi:hypothetical protein
VASDLHIVIGTGPQGVSVHQEIRLLKPALLYADRVTLLSPVAAALGAVESVGHLDEDGLIAFVKEVAPALNPKAAQSLEIFEQLRKKRQKTKPELVALMQLRAQLRTMATEWQATVTEMQVDAGVPEIEPAISAGLLTVDPLVDGAGEADEDVLFKGFMAKLDNLLRDSNAYPLFDDMTGGLVRAGIAEGLFELAPSARSHGKQVAVASDFISRAPAFPRAGITEILDIRDELSNPLGRFRGAVADMARRLDAAAHDESFSAEVQELYEAEVEPALLEIAEAIASNTYLRQLIDAPYSSVRELVLGGSAITLGLTKLAAMPSLAAGSIATAAGAGDIVARATKRKMDVQAETQTHRLYFLYREAELLAD